jgi:hypothetical protein
MQYLRLFIERCLLCVDTCSDIKSAQLQGVYPVVALYLRRLFDDTEE